MTEDVLSQEAAAFVEMLHRELNPRRLQLLERRHERQLDLDAGALPGFLPETRAVREGDWRVAPAPADLQDRRCEITSQSHCLLAAERLDLRELLR